MRIKVTQRVVTAFNEFDMRLRVAGLHFVPAQHFVAFRDDGQIVLRPGQWPCTQRLQLIDKFRPKEKTAMIKINNLIYLSCWPMVKWNCDPLFCVAPGNVSNP